MFLFGNVIALVHSDLGLLFGHSAEDIQFQGDEIFYEFFKSISDGNDFSLFDMSSVLAFKEGFSYTGLISDDGVDHLDFETGLGFDIFRFGRNNLNNYVISASNFLKVSNFNKGRFPEFLS